MNNLLADWLLGNVDTVIMARSFDLILLSCETDSPSDRTAAIQAIFAVISTRGAFVNCSLAKDAVEIALDVFDKHRFDCVFSMDWDPVRNSDSVTTWNIGTNDELLSISESMGAEFQSIDFDHDYIEAEENYEKRLREKMFESVATTKIVITPPPVLASCLEIAGIRMSTTPVMVLLKVHLDGRRIALQQTYESWASVLAFAHSIETSPLSQESHSPLLQSSLHSSQYQLLPDSQVDKVLPSALETQIKALSEQFSQSLGAALHSSLQKCQTGGSDPSDQVVHSVNQSLSALNDRFSSTLSSLDARLREVDLFKTAQKGEIDKLLAEFQGINENQKGVERVLMEIWEKVTPAVEELNEKLRKAEEMQRELRREIEEAMSAKAIASFPLFIKNVEKRADNCYHAEIVSRKHYPVYGFLSVIKEDGNVLNSQNTITFQSSEMVNMTSLVGLQQPGWYEVSVLHYADRSEICRRFRFSIEESGVAFPKPLRHYSASLVYKELQDLEDNVLLVKGEAGVAMLRKLASEWSNESPDLLENFRQTVLDQSLTDEAAVRLQLTHQEIRF